MARLPGIALLALVLLGPGSRPALAASAADLQSMSQMALLLGRATACGLDTRRAAGAIAAWLDQTFPPGSTDQARYMPAFAADVRRHARQQQQGDTSDSCADVADALHALNW